MVRLDRIADLADAFVRVRLTRVAGVDLRVFDFDYDLTWYAFLMSPDGAIYGRYGGRDAADAEARLSLAGLRHAMLAARETHQRRPPAPRLDGPPVRAEDYAAAKRLRPGECIHCHQINEFRRAEHKAAGTWTHDLVWAYPLPENVGLTLDVDVGDRVKAVTPGSAADRAGLRAGDVIDTLNALPVHSFADAQYALHGAPKAGRVPVRWRRGSEAFTADLELPAGWRKTNVTWRPSLLDVLPSLALFGRDLPPAEKRKLGLPEKALAFVQEKPVPRDLAAAGVQGGDVILGVNGEPTAMSQEAFLGHVRQNYLVGDRVTLNVLRAGRRVDVPLTLR